MDVDAKEAAAGALACLNEYLDAINARDLSRLISIFHFPAALFAGPNMHVIDESYYTPAFFDYMGARDWDRSAYDKKEVLHASVDKVHISVVFTRYRKDGSVLEQGDGIYILTREKGNWGLRAISIF